MNRWFWALALAALLWSPEAGVDVGELRPVQVVSLSRGSGGILLETDVGVWGIGGDVRQAMEDLQAGAEGVVVLDTAEFLLVDRLDGALIDQIGPWLRPSCMICIGDADPQTVAGFLQTHKPTVTLSLYRACGQMPERLEQKDGRLALVS